MLLFGVCDLPGLPLTPSHAVVAFPLAPHSHYVDVCDDDDDDDATASRTSVSLRLSLASVMRSSSLASSSCVAASRAAWRDAFVSNEGKIDESARAWRTRARLLRERTPNDAARLVSASESGRVLGNGLRVRDGIGA